MAVPFGFRKSLKIAPGLRLNLSKSGIGMSAGFRGFRIGSGPRGAYWRVGAKGFSYQQRIGGARQPGVSSSHTGSNAASLVQNTILGSGPGAGDEVAARYGEARKRIAYTPWFCTFGGLAVVCALANWPAWMTFVLAVAVVVSAVYLAREDALRRSIRVDYTLDPRQKAAYDNLQRALNEIAQCAATWCVVATSSVYWKQHAGANALVTRIPARVTTNPLAGFVTNVNPWTLEIQGSTLAFLPDRLLIVRGRDASDAHYRDVRVAESYTDFREDGAAPRDAMRIGTTWLHPNKNGDADRRYAYNPQIPVFRYSELQISVGAVSAVLQFSRSDVAAALARAVRAMP